MPGEKISTTTANVSAARKVKFPETSDFEQRQVRRPASAALAVGEWKAALRSTEITDHQQKIKKFVPGRTLHGVWVRLWWFRRSRFL